MAAPTRWQPFGSEARPVSEPAQDAPEGLVPRTPVAVPAAVPACPLIRSGSVWRRRSFQASGPAARRGVVHMDVVDRSVLEHRRRHRDQLGAIGHGGVAEALPARIAGLLGHDPHDRAGLVRSTATNVRIEGDDDWTAGRNGTGTHGCQCASPRPPTLAGIGHSARCGRTVRSGEVRSGRVGSGQISSGRWAK